MTGHDSWERSGAAARPAGEIDFREHAACFAEYAGDLALLQDAQAVAVVSGQPRVPTPKATCTATNGPSPGPARWPSGLPCPVTSVRVQTQH
jgi:hypothetical protein